MIPVGTLLTFFEIDGRSLVINAQGIAVGPQVYFHNGQSELQGNVVWRGITYMAFPIQATGFEYRGDAGLPRPELTIANVDGYVGGLTRYYGDLVGAKLIRRRTYGRYLDAVNFIDGNPEGWTAADGDNLSFPDDVFVIDRKAYEDKNMVKFECTSVLDLENVRIPARSISALTCPFRYKGGDCPYTGALPSCDKGFKTTNGCTAHFPSGPVPFGGFPGAGRNRS